MEAAMSSSDYRKKVIKIRVTDEEYVTLSNAKTVGRLATWMRDICMLAAVPDKKRGKAPATPPPADPAVLRQLAGIGGNLNQVARALNRYEVSALDKVKLLAQLAALERATLELKEVLFDHPVQ